LLQERLVISFHGNDRDVAHRTKLAAVVEVLVLETKEVPNKTPEIAQNTKYLRLVKLALIFGFRSE